MLVTNIRNFNAMLFDKCREKWVQYILRLIMMVRLILNDLKFYYKLRGKEFLNVTHTIETDKKKESKLPPSLDKQKCEESLLFKRG